MKAMPACFTDVCPLAWMLCAAICDKCNIPVASGGCKCDNNCNCISTAGVCDKCNIPVASGGCKCDNNCNCLATSKSETCYAHTITYTKHAHT